MLYSAKFLRRAIAARDTEVVRALVSEPLQVDDMSSLANPTLAARCGAHRGACDFETRVCARTHFLFSCDLVSHVHAHSRTHAHSQKASLLAQLRDRGELHFLLVRGRNAQMNQPVARTAGCQFAHATYTAVRVADSRM